MLLPFIPELVMSTDLLSFEHPSVLLFCWDQTDKTFHQFHDPDTELDLHRIMGGFYGAFATVLACQQGTLSLLDTWFRLPFSGLARAPVVATSFPKLAVCLFSTFHLEYPSELSRFLIDTWSCFCITHVSCYFLLKKKTSALVKLEEWYAHIY